MEKPLDSVFVFQAYRLCCVPCVENLKKILLENTGIAEVHADFEKNTVTIKDNIHIVKLVTIFQKINIDADLVYYKKERYEDRDQRKETGDEKENGFCASDQDEVKDTDADHHMFKGHDQRKESRGKKAKECFREDDEAEDIGADYHMFKNHDQRKEQRGRKGKECFHEAEDIGADHYKIRSTFKDHKPEKYVPPKEEYYWGDVRSGMHKKFPMMPRPGLQFTSGFPNYPGYHYPAPWPPQYYM